MARGLPTKTWVDPHSNRHDDPTVSTTFTDLSIFLARPKFYNGILLGDGTPPTRNANGVWVDPATLIDLRAKITELEGRIAALEGP